MEAMEKPQRETDGSGPRRTRSKRYGDKIRRVLSAIRGQKRRHRVSDCSVTSDDNADHASDATDAAAAGRQRLSVRVARKKSRSNSAVLAPAQDRLTGTEDEATLWTGAQITANKINLHMSSLQLDDDLHKDQATDRKVTTAHDDLMSLECNLARDAMPTRNYDYPSDDVSSGSNKSRQAQSQSRRHSTLSNPDLLKPRNRRPLVDINDTNDERAIEALRNSCSSRSKTRHSMLPVTWAYSDLRMDPQQLKMTPFRLGEGSYGRVMLGQYKGQRVAVKRILRQTRHDLEQELRMMHFLHDLDCTPKLIACELSQAPFTVLTSYHGKSIFDCLADTYLTKQLDWSSIIVDTVAAICRIHDMGVVHGDVKEDNVLLDNHGNRIKPIIIDYGLACFRNQARPMHVGPKDADRRRFMEKYPRVAPELITQNLPPDFSTDAYAVGYMIERLLRHVKVKRPGKFQKVAQKLLQTDLQSRISLHTALRQLQ